jgi:uncharacterized RDD family membrane protein YckC
MGYLSTEATMGQNWYYASGSQQLGPVSLEQISGMIRGGQVNTATLVWTDGMAQWLPIQQVPELSWMASGAQSPVIAAQYPGANQGYTGAIGCQSAYMTGQSEYAGFWMRFAAAIIDVIVMFIPGCIVGGIVGGIAGASGVRPNTPEWAGVSLVINLLSVVMNWLYFALMESSAKQATLGKMALSIKVIDVNGQRIGFGKATGRYFGKIISGIILAIGYMMAGWTERKQALHDMMASTLVVKGKA